jgi:uncharacterized membrane protein
MGKNRLEAFSDGVLAIIITIMVLEMKVPHGDDWQTLLRLWPVFISYVLSFIYIGIYWNNHHHLLHSIHKVNGAVLWANLHLLFWLSLLPFSTGWMGENHFAPNPTAVYGFNMLMSAVAYWILVRALIKLEGNDSVLAKAIGRDFKGNISVVIYIVGIASTFLLNGVALACYALVALIWLIPDKRIEKRL